MTEHALPESVQIRLMDMEYSNLTTEEIRQVYLEETGQEPPFDVTVYDSDKYVDEEEANGFDGTIVHIENDQGLNESYTITRGTQDFTEDDWHANDWSYNVMGIFAGQNDSQYRAAEKFHEKVTAEIANKTGNEPTKIGLGHSLGGNLITLLQLNSGGFESVYTVNAAPPSFYQLINIDPHFEREVRHEFQIDPNNLEELYNLDPKELQKFAEKHYESQGEDIHHLTSEQDIMTALFSVRGFFHVGDPPTTVDAFPDENVESLAALFKEIPDEFVKDVQIYIAENYTEVYNNDGFEGLFKELTGIDSRIVDWYLNQGEDLSFSEIVKYGLESLDGAAEKIPELTRLLEGLASDIPAVLDTLVAHDYLTKGESEIVHDEYMNILSHMQEIEKILEDGVKITQGDAGIAIINFIHHVQEIMDSADTINKNTKNLQEQFVLAVDAHKLKKVLQALGADVDISYEHIDGNFDMIISRKKDGKKIELNISSAMRMYTEGLSILESKQTVLDEIKSEYERKYIKNYTSRKERMMKKVRDMEESPYSYQSLMGNFTSDTEEFHRVTKIDVHEDIPSDLPEQLPIIYDNMFGYIEGVITKEKELLQKIKESVEELFEEDERIAEAIFGEGK